jgi:hypothetical protein
VRVLQQVQYGRRKTKTLLQHPRARIAFILMINEAGTACLFLIPTTIKQEEPSLNEGSLNHAFLYVATLLARYSSHEHLTSSLRETPRVQAPLILHLLEIGALHIKITSLNM